MENSTPSPFSSYTGTFIDGECVKDHLPLPIEETQLPGCPIPRQDFVGFEDQSQATAPSPSSRSTSALVTGHSWPARTIVLPRFDRRNNHDWQQTLRLRDVMTPQEETEKGASGLAIMAVTGMNVSIVQAEQCQVGELRMMCIRQVLDSVSFHIPNSFSNQAHLTVLENITTVLVPNIETALLWKIEFSVTSDGQQTRTEGLVIPNTVYSRTFVCPHCDIWNCRMHLRAEVETQGTSAVLKRLNLVRICIQNSEGVYNNAHVHSDNFCMLIRMRCGDTRSETYWKTTV